MPRLGHSNSLYTHSFSPTFVYLRGSGWNADLIAQEVEKARIIFDQCHIKLEPVETIEMEPLDGILDLTGQYDLKLVTALNRSERPLIFFLRNVGVAYSHGDDFTPNSPMKSLTDTSWLGTEILTSHYKLARDPRYSPVAHEIAHVLCNCGHVASGVRNILSGDSDFVSDQITPGQCEAFKQSPLVRALP